MLLPDLSCGLPGHAFHQLVAHPVLQRPVGDQDIAGAAGITLANANLLVADADHPDGTHLAGDPVLPGAVGPRRWLIDGAGGGYATAATALKAAAA